METFNQDPKPGRLVLPLVLIGMIATTYTFVNRVATNNDLNVLDVQEEVAVVEEETTDDTTTTSTTTTTLPLEVVTYLEEIQGEKVQSDELGQKVVEANENWDDRENTGLQYQEAKDEFANFIEDAEQFVTTVSEPGPPNTFANLVTSHEELKVLADLIYEDTKELLEGLTSSDTGERRAAALDSFNKNLALFQQKIEEIIASATSS
tara:strand:- start:992 stop:1612 length:621 start_codon:yes stop_codon:yes gene_type:complete